MDAAADNVDSAVATATVPSVDAVSDAGAKRKRDTDTSTIEVTVRTSSRLEHFQQDLIDVLESRDTTPTFLNHALARYESTKLEPVQKKARLSEPATDASTIAARLRNSDYDTLQDIRRDAKETAEAVVSDIRKLAGERDEGKTPRLTVEELKTIQKVQALQTLIDEAVTAEDHINTTTKTESDSTKQETSALTNGTLSKSNTITNHNGRVLTLFGNAPTPKQLFSSMQRFRSNIKSELPIDEMSLPNGITATQVVPVNLAETPKGPTFAEAFAPPYSLTALAPPVPPKRPATRDSAITWEFKDPIQRNRRGGYTVQPLTVGSWLGYGGAGKDAGVSSTQERLKQRDRALSSADGTERPTSSATDDDARALEEEALFRRAYSSFAPTVDNTDAMIASETKNAVWWHKVGRRRYADTFALDPALAEDDAQSSPPGPSLKTSSATELEDFSTILQDIDEVDKPDEDAEDAKLEPEVQDSLRHISDLLQTLASHQRIRNITLPVTTTARPSPGTSLASSSQTTGADSPSTEEVAVYERLRKELADLVLQLPPYAVAKLDGQQLADLGVSTIITYEAQNRRGIMEEDQVARSTKLAAMATANSIASLTRSNSSTANQHYSSGAQRTPAIGQAANTRYGQTQYGGRNNALSSFQRPNGYQQNYNTPTSGATRPQYSQPNMQNRPSVPQPAFGASAAQSNYSRTPQTNGYGGYNPQYQASTQGQARATFAANQYQGRPQPSAPAYQSTPTIPPAGLARTTSPAKPTMYNSPATQNPPQAQSSGVPRPNLPPSNNYPPQANSQPSNNYLPPRAPSQGTTPVPASTTPQPAQSVAPPPAPTAAMTTPSTPQPNGTA